MISSFAFISSNSDVVTFSGYRLEDRIKQTGDLVDSLTDEQVREYANRRRAAIEEHLSERRELANRLKNPQTLEDFRELIKAKGMDALTADQRAAYDRLIAEQTMSQGQAGAKRDGLQTDERIELGEPVEATHGKTGETIFNVKVVTRLGKDKFKEAAAFARSMGGGYYRGNFYFKTREDAELFSGWVNGESVDLDARGVKREESKSAVSADRLKKMADRLEQEAEERLNAPRKENTLRRIQEADRARAKSEKDMRIAEIMRRVADSDSSLLKGMTQKVQVELMDRLVRSLAWSADRDLTRTDSNGNRVFRDGVTNEEKVAGVKMPLVDLTKAGAQQLSSGMIGTKGFIMYGRKIAAMARSSDEVTLTGNTLEKAIAYIDKHADKYSFLKDAASDYKRLERMGITNRPTLRAAMLEFMTVSDGAYREAQGDRLQGLERDLQRTIAGNRNAFNDFFPTPDAVAEEVVGQAEIEPGMRVLEPSAGNGMLADAARNAGAEVDVVEQAGQLRAILAEKGFALVGDDFLEYRPSVPYDRIVMNPPFSNDQDIQHVEHAYTMLKPAADWLPSFLAWLVIVPTRATDSSASGWMR